MVRQIGSMIVRKKSKKIGSKMIVIFKSNDCVGVSKEMFGK